MTYDILIIGAGPAGATAALLLAQAGFSIAIVEQKKFPRQKVCGEYISATSFALLQKLGIADLYTQQSGPEIQRMGVYAGETLLTSAMPSLKTSAVRWGRAIGREHLDTELLNKAIALGAQCWQPAKVLSIDQQETFATCKISANNSLAEISARLVIYAAGSWERQLKNKIPHKDSDLLAFKAHFRHCDLPNDIMPLIAFPGGYGGVVNTDDGRVTMSFCIRRETLRRVRKQYPALTAGEAVMAHTIHTCRGIREAFKRATREGNWLAAGPIRPGIRKFHEKRIFYVGNMAGEAHPVIAEGISMAMQSAWILAGTLIKYREDIFIRNNLEPAGKEYKKRWHASFAARLRFAGLFAQMAMRPRIIAFTLPIFSRFPGLMSFAAKLSGKTRQVIQP